VRSLAGIDAVIVGGGLYANRWHRAARRFVLRHREALRQLPVWFFSSGPLDDRADREILAPPGQVQRLMERVGALTHVTFGGRLSPDARGFPASAMARTHAGDWRNPERIRAWAAELARRLTPVEHAAVPT
jgi:menaquinone-dependent protoporphyrinogen oxidase